MIGYYVHHHGSGHQRRLQAIARHLRGPMTVLSSASRPAGYDGLWVSLAPDVGGPSPVDPTAHATSHWSPLGHEGLRARMAAVARWVDEARPSIFIVDVSCEIARFVRLMGIPVIVVAMRGDRSDRVHVDTYDLAEALLAPWSLEFAEPDWPEHWREKACHVGAFSIFDGRTPVVSRRASRRPRVALLWGSGGSGVTAADVERARAATPGWDWDVLGLAGHPWHDDPWSVLSAADVVVTHAGQNAIAEVAAARKPAVVLPQRRPHGEQEATARALQRGDLATVLTSWPHAGLWPEILQTSRGRDAGSWGRWAPGDGAARAAAFIERMAAGNRAVAA